MSQSIPEINAILKTEADHECAGFGAQHICVKIAAIAELPTRFGRFQVFGFWNDRDDKDHLAIMHGNAMGRENVPTHPGSTGQAPHAGAS